MEKFTKLPFKTKILLYVSLVTLMSLILTGVGFISYDIRDTKQNLVESLNITSDIISTYSATALSVGNRDEVNEVIDKLSISPYMRGVWVYDKNGKLFAVYDPDKRGWYQLPNRYQEAGAYFYTNSVVVSNPILFGKNKLGTLVVMSDLAGLKYRVIHQITVIIALILFSLMGALLITFRMQSLIIKPIAMLVETVKTIAKKNDYSIRATKITEDEFGVLTDAFNNMLSEVEARNKALKKSEQRLNLALWGSNEVMIDRDLKSDKIYYDDRVELLLGYKNTEMPTCHAEFIKIQHPGDRFSADEKLKQHLIGRTSFYEIEYRLRAKDNTWRWILGRGKVVERDETGKALRLIGTLVDITDRKQHEESLRLFQKVFESMTEGVIVTNPTLLIVEVNSAFTAITGYERQEVKGLSLDAFRSEKHDAEFYENMRQLIEKNGHWEGEVWQKRKTGEFYLQRLTVNAMHDEKSQLIHYVAVFSDISRWKKAEDELEYISNYDVLTNLPNRNRFMIHLSDLLEEAKQQDRQLALMTVGVDRFKIINDTFGHSIGDRLLRSIAKRLKRFLENDHDVARFTGDEFAIVIADFKDVAQLKTIAHDVLKVLSKPFLIDGHDILLGASIGISMYPTDATDVQTMAANSDVALFYAKQKERNSYQFYNTAINKHVLERHKLESSLRKALENNEFSLHYQPKVEVGTGKIMGSEALIRWEHPKLGMVSPDKFISLAEETGIIVPIGLWALREACTQNKRWQEAGFTDLNVSVNLSAYQFRGGDLAEDIAQVLWDTKLSPESLDLELTETVLMENADRCVLMLSVLKAMGVTITVDDFGTGYSSLNYLRRFQIDGLKIDRSFVQNVTANSEDAAIIKAILAMAKGLQLKTVAEGVETKEQLVFLTEHHCDIIQGYYYARPLTVAQFTALLNDSQGFLKTA